MNDDEPYDAEYDISIHNQHGAAWVDEPLIKRGVTAVLERFEIATAEVSVAVVTDDHIARLHQDFLAIPGPTDVLTFDLGNDHNDSTIDGEIVVSADTAARLADEKGHAPAAELTLYGVHGALHLVGLDDKDVEDARAMHAVEDEILIDLGVGPVFGD